ncbi:unnamed protein product [[Candida] boidinii]|uniref:Unnamed protein product n=1 Tax=Candida boidinii TaxID=5477 RepID=A0A9W6SYA8_CANBO|nr:hypothetical protein B5S30_g3164 [[Candida] boidinii]OWB84790.1 hypothetical protein B5S33_g3443 [[Candida] boidinii]GME68576.1 unnamed protein product [[Candida] boidinii]
MSKEESPNDITETMVTGSFSSFDNDSSNSDSVLKSTLKAPNDEDNASVLLGVGSDKLSMMGIVLTVMASFSGFMFGYDTGYISSALVSIGDDFGAPLSYGQSELITAATSLGALISSIFAGMAADTFGRKPVLMFSNLLFILGAIIQCAAQNVWTMIVGRFVGMGFGVGIGSLIAPLYIAELAPSKFRGRLVVVNCLCITGGQLIAYAIGAGLEKSHNGWRIVIGLSMIPPVVQFIAFVFLPDTPRFLISKGRIEKAKKVLKLVNPATEDEIIDMRVDELQSMNDELPGKNPIEKTWNAIKEIHRVPSNFRALVIACGLQGIQQFTGFNSLMYFSSTIFKAIGFDNSSAVSLIVAGTNFGATIVAFFIIDKVGRRNMLLLGIPLMIVFLVLNAIAFHFLDIKFDHNNAILNSDGTDTWGIAIIVFMILFVASYAIGIGNVPWQQSELFPQNVRGVGASFATATNWAGSLVISSTFLTMLQNITPTGTFSLFAAISFVSLVFVWFCYPELSNLELEEVQQILTGGFNISDSRKLAKLRRDSGAIHKEKNHDKISHEHIDQV